MKDRIFIDGIESISIVDGVARLETFVFKSGERKDGQASPEHLPGAEIIMSLGGLSRLHDGIGRLIEDMKKRQNAAMAADGSDNFPAKRN